MNSLLDACKTRDIITLWPKFSRMIIQLPMDQIPQQSKHFRNYISTSYPAANDLMDDDELAFISILQGITTAIADGLRYTSADPSGRKLKAGMKIRMFSERLLILNPQTENMIKIHTFKPGVVYTVKAIGPIKNSEQSLVFTECHHQLLLDWTTFEIV